MKILGFIGKLEKKEKIKNDIKYMKLQKRKENDLCYKCVWGTWTGLKYKCMFGRCVKGKM